MKPSAKIILFLLLIVGAAFFVNNYMVVGTTTLSLNKIDFQSYDSILDGEVWAIYFSEGGLAQHYYGVVPAGTTETDGTVKTEKPFTLDITDSQQKCEYPINIDYSTDKIFTLSYVKIPLVSSLTDWTRVVYCTDFAGGRDNIVAIGKPASSFEYICIYKIPQSSNIATFNDHNVKFETDFRMTVGDTVYTNSVGTDTEAGMPISNTVMFGDIGYIKWIGNLETGTNCPSPAGRNLAAFTDNKWRIIGDANYNQYVNYYDANFIVVSWTDDTEMIVTKIIEHNRNANGALSLVPFKNSIASGTELNGNVVINLDSGVQIPTYVAYISADKVKGLGVYQPVAYPKITTVDNIIFKTGETGYVNVGIKNIGEERGGFYTSVYCPNTVSMVGTAKYTSLGAGNDALVTIPVTGNPSSNIDIICTAKTEVLGKFDTETFTIRVDVQQVCVPGTEICNFGVPQICKTDGSGWTTQNSDRCDVNGGIGGFLLFDNILNSLFGDEFGVDDILPLLILIVVIILIVALLWLTLPILIPLVVKAFIGLIVRK